MESVRVLWEGHLLASALGTGILMSALQKNELHPAGEQKSRKEKEHDRHYRQYENHSRPMVRHQGMTGSHT